MYVEYFMVAMAVADLEIWKGGSVVNVVERGVKGRSVVRGNFFRGLFQLPGWAVVAPSCFALHCHCSLVSVQRLHDSLLL